eukprot:11162701-Karenia_brevis.AAC.1
MVMKHAGCTASEKSVMRAFHAQGVWFHRLREKPTLTPEDIKMRLKFATANGKIRADQWIEKPHAIIDNKSWP